MPEQSLRIVMISSSDRGGGAERTAWMLHRTFRERGHESTMFVGRKASDDPSVIELDNWIPRFSPRRLARNAADQLGLEDRFLKGGREIMSLVGADVDIVHAHNLHSRYFDLGHLPRLARRWPTVLTLQDMWLLTGHCAHSFDCPRWETGCGHCPDLTIYPAVRRDATRTNFRRKARLLDERPLSVSAPSEWLLDRVRRSHLGSLPSRLIPNAVDTSVFRPADAREARDSLGLPQDRPVIFFPANIGLDNRFKDPSAFLGALRRLQDLQVVALAFSSTGTRSEGPDGLIALEPTEDEAEMARLYQAADVVVHPSRAETSPLAVAEALASARPVVATLVGGIPEIVEHEKTGLLASAGDDEAIAGMIRLLIARPELRMQMGEAGVAVVHQRFELQRIADAWLDWYGELRERN